VSNWLCLRANLIALVGALTVVASFATAGDRLLIGKRQTDTEAPTRVKYRCLTCEAGMPVNEPVNGHRHRPTGDRWALPTAQAADSTIRCLVLRFNFQFESTDDPNTTGRGQMNVADPLSNPADSAAFIDSVGHFIDPPPHDSAYFHAHMRALNAFWNHASRDIIDLSWQIYPYGATATYTLPEPMSTYGACSNNISDVIAGLERYFIDCIQLADTAHLLDPVAYPDIDFSQYDAIFLFHAGSDRQNDIGFPPTCSDLFTGFIRFGDSLAVDGGTEFVRTALMMPETASQDNRATALNAVMAHEFGHQLGLVDLYSTTNFLSQLGDFALMDNNGFGTGVDFGFSVGNVFGTVPVMPMAWSRAFLGFDPVLDVRNGDDIRIVAAANESTARRVVRVPISEKEYYLVENRTVDIYPDPGGIQPVRLDSTSNVILGPARRAIVGNDTVPVPTTEYDALMPGNGMMIFHVDEEVAGQDFDGDGVNNFDDNQLQLNPDQRFIRIIEADGLVNFGGFYRAGFGSSADMFREDRQSSFTPNTNPPAIDNTGNNTHVYITDIRRDTDFNPVTGDSVPIDSVMLFDVEVDKLADGFPVRLKLPEFPLNPVIADIDEDGESDIIAASDNRVFAFTPSGENLIHKMSGCVVGVDCVLYGDSSGSTVNPGTPYVVPLYAQVPGTITAGPVVGTFGSEQLVAVGYDMGDGTGEVAIYRPVDGNLNSQADLAATFGTPSGVPLALSFGTTLQALVESGVWTYPSFDSTDRVFSPLPATEYYGLCRLDDSLYVITGNTVSTWAVKLPGTSAADSLLFDGDFSLGPILADFNRDGKMELVLCSRDGDIGIAGVAEPQLTPEAKIFSTGYSFTTNPLAADVNSDGYPELVVGGVNAVHAFNVRPNLQSIVTSVSGYPIEANDRFPGDDVIASPIVANYAGGGAPEIAFPTLIGNVYSFGPEPTYGFPVSAGERGAGSPVYHTDATSGYLGYLGADGWFYAWEVEADSAEAYWPMGGAEPSGSFRFDSTRLAPVAGLAGGFDEERFYNYPNPVVDGRTTFRYFLSEVANDVTLRIYDLSGQEIASLTGPTQEGVDVEVDWDCADITPGVYRCMIEVDYVSGMKHAFTDVAIIR